MDVEQAKCVIALVVDNPQGSLSRWRHGFESRWDCHCWIVQELLMTVVQIRPMTIKNR
jgi:hypothetical protein